MTTTTTRFPQDTPDGAPTLYLAFELSEKQWKLAFTTGLGQRPRLRGMPARDLEKLDREIAAAKRRFGLPATAPVVSCYEAGRDGFWIHRALAARGIANSVVDSASIEVNRRKRRAKADKLDADKLVLMLVRFHAGDRRTWRVARVPSEAEEDRRWLSRELEAVLADRSRVANRISSLLTLYGVGVKLTGDVPGKLAALRCWDGAPLPPQLLERLGREWAAYQQLSARVRELKQARQREIHGPVAADDAKAQGVMQALVALRGIGPAGSHTYTREFFGWRSFQNRRQVGGLAGLVPTPYSSGAVQHEQGISKAGNRHMRRLAVELAWIWLRCQPTSALSRWYQERYARGTGRERRIGIVALARKLLIALWRYVDQGILPAGAQLKAA
jgi:transposase